MSEDDAVALKRSIGFGSTSYTVEAERMPSYSEVSGILNKVAFERDGQWCGIPMPLPGLGLELAPGYPHAEEVRAMQDAMDGASPSLPEIKDKIWTEVNRWSCLTHGGDIVIVKDTRDNTHLWYLDAYAPRRNRFLFGPLDTADAWSLDTEVTALQRLSTLVPKRQFDQYMLTGSFIERSCRSDLHYMFRRNRPTAVLTTRRHPSEIRVLVCLCLHPLAYYTGTFCGAMVPTDDIIAHLLLMRADEHLFWKRANQHPAYMPESGL